MKAMKRCSIRSLSFEKPIVSLPPEAQEEQDDDVVVILSTLMTLSFIISASFLFECRFFICSSREIKSSIDHQHR